jgi:diadenosine tetraphosphate (Ap4A) HIT family hydrolase
MKISDIHGNTTEVTCIACDIQSGKIKAPDGVIASTEFFQAEQDYEIPIPGFVIIVSKRHYLAVDEMTSEERHDFIDFVARVREAMRRELNITYIQLVLEENTSSSHFHLWLFPRYDWMEPFGAKIESVPNLMKHARAHLKTEENLREVREATEKLRRVLL